MILQHLTDENKKPDENSFEAYDEIRKFSLGKCVLSYTSNRFLFPNRPSRVFIEISGREIPDALLGAAVARARQLAVGLGLPARIYTKIEPDDDTLLPQLNIMGFEDNDGLVMMRCETNPDVAEDDIILPSGCVTLEDSLEEEIEQRFFLERYNELFGEDNDRAWLDALITSPGFGRRLIISPGGLVGEAAYRVTGESCELLWLFTVLNRRHNGIASKMLALLRASLSCRGVREITAQVQAKVPNIMHTLERAGFKQTRLICRYPGLDIDRPVQAVKSAENKPCS